MEGMRVRVAHDRDDKPAEHSRRCRLLGAGFDRCDAPFAHADQNGVRDAVVQPCVFAPERFGRHGDTQSAITSASASAPVRQSAISAYSSGECDTPVGLRTNNIAVGTLAERIPASWPAAVGSTGT